MGRVRKGASVESNEWVGSTVSLETHGQPHIQHCTSFRACAPKSCLIGNVNMDIGVILYMYPLKHKYGYPICILF